MRTRLLKTKVRLLYSPNDIRTRDALFKVKSANHFNRRSSRSHTADAGSWRLMMPMVDGLLACRVQYWWCIRCICIGSHGHGIDIDIGILYYHTQGASNRSLATRLLVILSLAETLQPNNVVQVPTVFDPKASRRSFGTLLQLDIFKEKSQNPTGSQTKC